VRMEKGVSTRERGVKGGNAGNAESAGNTESAGGTARRALGT